MNDLMVFSSEEFGKVRTIVINDEPWFVSKDIATALGYKNTNASVHDNVDEEDRRVSAVPTPSGNQNMNVINESGLYSLIFNSRLNSAKKFKKWVTSEVLPQIRKTGGYGNAPALPTDTKGQIKLLSKGVDELYEKVDVIQNDVADLKDNLPLFPVEADEVVHSVKRKGIEVMGGKSSPAYHDKSISSSVYRDIYGEIWKQMGVSSYKALPRKKLGETLEVIAEYKVPRILRERIAGANTVC